MLEECGFRIKKNKRLFNNLRLSSKRRSRTHDKEKNGVQANQSPPEEPPSPRQDSNGDMSYKNLLKKEGDCPPEAQLMLETNAAVTGAAEANHTDSADKDEIEKISSPSNGNLDNGVADNSKGSNKKIAAVSVACTMAAKPPGGKRISIPREKKAAIVLGIIMGLFILCWMPFFLMLVVIENTSFLITALIIILSDFTMGGVL